MLGEASELLAARRIDALCDEFERTLADGKSPSIESFLSKVPADERLSLRVELLGLEVDYRRAQGHCPTVAEYAGRFPEFSATQLEEFFSTSDRDPSSLNSRASTVSPGDSTTQDAGGLKRLRDFGDFELLREIARGGMGVVYEARQRSLDRPVALKMILSGQLAGAEEVARFRREAEAVARLDHPGIVPIFEIGANGDQHYFTMALVPGPSLSAQLLERTLAPREAAALVRDVALAVQYAHERGVVHRDLKPSNILLGPRSDREPQEPAFAPRVTDFGLAKFSHGDNSLTETGQILGTPGYMPPEQAAGLTSMIGPAADIYALGAVLHACLTGRPPFQADCVLDTVRQVLERDPVPPRGLNPAIPRDLETICLKCLEKPISRRYGSARAVADELQRFLDGRPIEARPVSRRERASRWLIRNAVVASLVTAGLVVLTALGLASDRWWKEHRSQAELTVRKAGEAAEKARADVAETDGRTADFYATLERIRNRRSGRIPGWADANRTDLARLAASPRGEEFHLRCEAAAMAAGVDLGTPKAISADFRPYDVAFDPTGRLLAIGALANDQAEAGVRIVDWERGVDILTFSIPVDRDWESRAGGRSDGCWSIAFSPDGSLLAVGTRSGWVMVWELSRADTQPAAKWRHLPYVGPPGAVQLDRVTRLAFGPDGQLWSGDNRTVARWDPKIEWLETQRQEGYLSHVASGRPVHDPEIRPCPSAMHPVRYLNIQSPNSSWDLLVCRDSVPMGKLALPDSDHADDGFISEFSVSPDGTLLAASSAHVGHLKLWELASGRVLSAQTLEPGSKRMAFHPAGSPLAVVEDHRVLLFGIRPPPVVNTVAIQPWPLDDADLTRLGRHVATAATILTPPPFVTVLQLHDLTLHPSTSLVAESQSFPPAGRRRLALSPDALWAVTNGNTYKQAFLQGQVVHFAGPANTQDLRFGGKQLWALGPKSVHAWPNTADTARMVVTDEPGVTCLAAGEGGAWVGTDDGSIAFYSTAGRRIRSVPLDGGEIKGLAWDGGRRIIAGTAAGDLLILDAERVVRRISRAHAESIRAIANGPGGWFATGSADRNVTIWNPAGTAVVTLPQTRPVQRLFWSSDGRLLSLLAPGERAVRQWRIDALKAEFRRLGLEDGLPEATISVTPSNARPEDNTMADMRREKVPVTVGETRDDKMPTPVASQTPAGSSPERFAGEMRDDNALKMKLLWCPPGTFLMGSRESVRGVRGNEIPRVEVALMRGFWMGQTEVTQDQVRQILGIEPWKNTPGTGDDLVKEGPDYAATCLSWDEATGFAAKLTDMERGAGRLPNNEEYRIPTEAEWEYACRADTETLFWFGNDPSQLRQHEWCKDNAYLGDNRHVQEVGLKTANAWRLYDMHGNVAEWCRDWYGDKLPGGVNPENGTAASFRVARGGCWYYAPVICRSSVRNWSAPELRFHYLGCRIVRSQSGR